ncbi:uncharacterized protein LOC119665034 [Teleopsis dalmanni]|uniref:uncharacterized protein LOC119665034 n=1 Tax=Teleopsis dalmanni TaxID=139649 RepID=UPI0018CE59EC|nr:uncharacterized protein LOC119665034 [Teleopsis dalmanni]
MGCGKSLTTYEKGFIGGKVVEGVGMRQIAKDLGRSLCVVQNYLKDRENYGKKRVLVEKKYFPRPQCAPLDELPQILL